MSERCWSTEVPERREQGLLEPDRVGQRGGGGAGLLGLREDRLSGQTPSSCGGRKGLGTWTWGF